MLIIKALINYTKYYKYKHKYLNILNTSTTIKYKLTNT